MNVAEVKVANGTVWMPVAKTHTVCYSCSMADAVENFSKSLKSDEYILEWKIIHRKAKAL